MQERSRALNRHHKARMKVRATKYLHDRNSSLEGFLGGLERHVGRNACTPTNCSCHMCGNPRKHFGDDTIAEQSDKEFMRNNDEPN